jgi:hypothetical protein
MMRRLLFLCLALLLASLPAAAQDGDTIAIQFPPPVYSLSGAVDLYGTVNPPDLFSYFIEVAPYNPALPDAPVTWIPASLPATAPVSADVIARWDTTILPDGLYQLRLQVLLTSGQTQVETVAPLRVANNLEGTPAATQVAQAVTFATNTPIALQPVTPGAVIIPTLTPPPAPTEPPTPDAPTLVPRPDPVNTLPLPVGGHISGFNESTIPLISDAGLTWIKWQIPFFLDDPSLLDVARDRINWTHERGFRIFLSIKGDKDQMAAVGFDEYFPQYAAFVGQIAEMQPEAIQIWNEMNLDREWPNGQINPAAYVELLRQSYEAIKAADPSVLVVTGAPAPTGAESVFGSAAVWNDDRYYAGMASAGAAAYADCIGVHYNEGIIPPVQRGGDPRDNDYPTRYLPLMMERAYFPFRSTDARLCFSEMGYITPDGYPGTLPDGFSWGNNVSLQEHADWLRDAITVISESSVPVDLVIIWNLDFSSVEGDPQGAYAIVRSDGSCPACQTIATLRN